MGLVLATAAPNRALDPQVLDVVCGAHEVGCPGRGPLAAPYVGGAIRQQEVHSVHLHAHVLSPDAQQGHAQFDELAVAAAGVSTHPPPAI